MTDLFTSVADYIKQQKCQPSEKRGTDYLFSMPPEMPYAERELLAAAARAIDPSIDVLRATREGRLTFSRHAFGDNQPCEQFPVQAMLRKLSDIKRAVAESVQPVNINDGSLTFEQGNNLPLVELEYVIRAALPYPTPIAMYYDLPEGKTYHDHNKPVQGRVDLPKLCWLKEHAEREMDYQAAAELAALRAQRIVVRAEDAELLRARLGLSDGRSHEISPGN